MSSVSSLTAVEEVARLAGNVALKSFGGRVDYNLKADNTPVTEADRSAELKARDWIQEHFPDDGIIGEEFGALKPEARRQWIIDPIDGTRSYMRGVPLWGTLIALKEGSEVIAGAAYFPALNEMIVAATGEQCWWNGVRASVSPVSSLSEAAILTTDERFFQDGAAAAWRALAGRAEISRTWGDSYGYLLVATGRAEAMLDVGLAPWDSAPFYPIIREAGGRITDWEGKDIAGTSSVIATNEFLGDEIRSILVGIPSERKQNV